MCCRYLSNGRRRGRYWVVGDVANTPGRSLFVRLTGPDSGKGAAGKWTDAATGQHGDLLDLIALNRGLEEVFQGRAVKLASSRPWKQTWPMREPLGWSSAHPSPQASSISSFPSQENSIALPSPAP